jgi:peptide/nickel transport system permease protein
MLRHPSAWVGLLFLAAAVFGAVAAPWIAPAPPDEINLSAQLEPPSAAHPLGTDFFGRDLLSRLLFGGRLTLAVAGTAVVMAVLIGTAIGLLAGIASGWLSQAWVGLIDLLLAFPALLLALLVVALLGPGPGTLAVAVGVAGIPTYARLARSVVLTLRAAPYVDAARALGAGSGYILRHHLLPGVITPVLALAAVGTGTAILSVAALGFLGLGVTPPQPEWGLMLFEGRQYLGTAAWASLVPGLAIALTVLGVTLLGDALGDEH